MRAAVNTLDYMVSRRRLAGVKVIPESANIESDIRSTIIKERNVSETKFFVTINDIAV